MEYEKKQRIYKTIMLVVLTVTISVIATIIALYQYWGINQNVKYVMLPTSDSGVSSELAKIRSIVDKYYMGEIDEQSLIDGAIQGYIQGLNDKYSEYVPKEEAEEYTTKATGTYSGIGIYYGKTQDSKKVIIISTIKDSPAYKAGLQTGDIILKINDNEINSEETLTELSNKIKGEAGTEVKLVIQRNDEVKEYTFVRENIKMRYVYDDVIQDDIGYLELTNFDEGVADEFKEKYEQLKSKGIKSLIIDLRSNGGGIVQEATQIADYMLDKDKTILITKDKNGKEEITKAEEDKLIDIPVVVLTDKGSASASEILAGALKDNNVAKIIGEKTYGKGVIQNLFTLKSGAMLKLTTNEYFTPNNIAINNIGIEPDIEVKLPTPQNKDVEIEDTQLQKAIEILKQ